MQPNKYDFFFSIVNRKVRRRVRLANKRRGTERNNVKVIKPELLSDFVTLVTKDGTIQVNERVLVVLIAGCGGRISEVLDLKPTDFEEDTEGDLYFTLQCFKKARREEARLNAERRKLGIPEKEWAPIFRKCKVPTVARDMVKQYIGQLTPDTRLFNFSRFSALRIVKRLFGRDMETHSFRHSYFSWLGDKQVGPAQKTHEIAEVMQVHPDTVITYFHIPDMKKHLKKFGL